MLSASAGASPENFFLSHFNSLEKLKALVPSYAHGLAAAKARSERRSELDKLRKDRRGLVKRRVAKLERGLEEGGFVKRLA